MKGVLKHIHLRILNLEQLQKVNIIDQKEQVEVLQQLEQTDQLLLIKEVHKVNLHIQDLQVQQGQQGQVVIQDHLVLQEVQALIEVLHQVEVVHRILHHQEVLQKVIHLLQDLQVQEVLIVKVVQRLGVVEVIQEVHQVVQEVHQVEVQVDVDNKKGKLITSLFYNFIYFFHSFF
jgi:hypothetical protein